MKTKNGMINFYSIMCGLWIDLQSTISNIIRIRIKMIGIDLNSYSLYEILLQMNIPLDFSC